MYSPQGDAVGAPPPAKRPSATAAAAAYLIAVAGLALISVLYGPITRAASALFPGLSAHGVELVAQLAYYLPFMLLPALLLARRGGAEDAARLTRPVGPVGMLGVAALALAGLLFVQYLSVLWTMLMEALNVPLLDMSPTLPDNVPDAMLMVIYYAALPGVCEEVFFRGAMLGAFERVGTRRAVALTAVLFTLIHGSIEGFPAQLLLGLMLGYLAYAFDSVYAPIVYHTVHNAAIVLINLYATGTETTAQEAELLAQGTFAYFGGWPGVMQLVLYTALLGWAMRGFLRVVQHSAHRRGVACVPPGGEKLGVGARVLLGLGVAALALVYIANALIARELAGGAA